MEYQATLPEPDDSNYRESRDVPFSNLFWGLGICILFKVIYSQFAGHYYDGHALNYNTDTLIEHPVYFSGEVSEDYYNFRFDYSKSTFRILGNDCDIITDDKNKSAIVDSLKKGDIITIGYSAYAEHLVHSNENNVKVITLSAYGKPLLTAAEVEKADDHEKRMYYLAGLSIIAAGFISFYLRKRKKKVSPE